MFEELEDLSLHSQVAIQAPRKVKGSLKSLNLDNELYESYTQAKLFLEDIRGDTSIAPNQIAQVMNTLNTILKEITKMQTDLYDAERLKKLESCMIIALKSAPVDVQERFFEEYEILLGKP